MSTIVRSFRTCLLLAVLFVGVPSAAASAAESVVIPPLSDAIQVAADLRADVDEMLRSSATFRSQYQRIAAAPSIIIGVGVDPALFDRGFCARSRIRRYRSGLIVVAVTIKPGSHQAEWIAHEFEHVLEQLDGWNLGRLAAANAKHVWYSGFETIETSRAVEAGRKVREELQRHISRSDKLVE
jgi:hypothetical protein